MKGRELGMIILDKEDEVAGAFLFFKFNLHRLGKQI